MILLVEVRGAVETAPDLLKKLKKLGASLAPGHEPVPMQTFEKSFVLPVITDDEDLIDVLRRLPGIIEVFPDVVVDPMDGVSPADVIVEQLAEP